MSNPAQKQGDASREPQIGGTQAQPAGGDHPGHVTDIALARVIAGAMRDAPGGARLISGHSVAATYGPNERVEGVVIRHLASGGLTLAVHIAVAESIVLGMAAPSRPILPELADGVRDAIERSLRKAGAPAPESIDVHIDDMWR